MNGSNISTLPRITSTSPVEPYDFPASPDHFQVREIPLYEINNEGPHLYFEVNKRNLTTEQATQILSDQLDVSAQKFGVAGRKDKNADTTQRMSLEHVEPAELEQVNHPNLSIKVLGNHRNKLQPGHLKGNKFRVKLENLEGSNISESIIDNQNEIDERGLPNYYGPQRFGRRGDTAKLGECMVKDELDQFLDYYFGKPGSGEPEQCRKARKFYDDGQLEKALQQWPNHYTDKRNGLSALIERSQPGPVLSAISYNKRKLFVSAYQSQLFNELLASRIDSIDKVLVGDIAKKTDTGGMFRVEHQEKEQPRAETFNISPTGLLPGSDPWLATEEAGKLEQTILENHDLRLDDFRKVEYLGAEGSRRVLRVPVKEINYSFDRSGGNTRLDLEFFLQSGSYATIFLRELLGALPDEGSEQ